MWAGDAGSGGRLGQTVRQIGRVRERRAERCAMVKAMAAFLPASGKRWLGH